MTKDEEYRKAFGLGEPADLEKAKKALEQALDIRKFEIGLYWHRAAYFWALIAGAFAAYFAILGAEHLADKEYLAYIVSCIGLVFTWAWFWANRGSKYWQENWENHVDMLEDAVTGPLYKTRLQRPDPPDNLCERLVTGPSDKSVSKINQWVSLFTLCVWAALLLHALPEFDPSQRISGRHVLVACLTVAAGLLMVHRGKTYQGDHEHVMLTRKTRIAEDEPVAEAKGK